MQSLTASPGPHEPADPKRPARGISMSISELPEIQGSIDVESSKLSNPIKPNGNKKPKKRSSLHDIPDFCMPKRARRINQCPWFSQCLGLAAIEDWEMFICDACPKLMNYD